MRSSLHGPSAFPATMDTYNYFIFLLFAYKVQTVFRLTTSLVREHGVHEGPQDYFLVVVVIHGYSLWHTTLLKTLLELCFRWFFKIKNAVFKNAPKWRLY
jgi:hypothetical protein